MPESRTTYRVQMTIDAPDSVPDVGAVLAFAMRGSGLAVAITSVNEVHTDGQVLRALEQWYVACGCDQHGDHGGCVQECADSFGCVHPIGVEVSQPGTEAEVEARQSNPCGVESPETGRPCVLEATLADHQHGADQQSLWSHETALYGGDGAAWAVSPEDITRWAASSA